MKIKRVLIGAGLAVTVVASAVGVFAGVQSSAYDQSMDKVYDVPLPAVTRSADPAVIARGKHVVDAIAGCSTTSCHGSDLGGGHTVEMGPVGRFTGPNISPGGLGVAYSDGEIARLIRRGIKRDGRSVRFMPVQDFNWLPDDDVAAVVSYLRSVPSVDRTNGPVGFTTMAKVLDRSDKLVVDVARRLDRATFELPPPPSASPRYGRFLARACTGCHGEGLSGGPIPGAPPSLPVPLDLTPSDEGLGRWTFGDFDRALTLGVKPDGSEINRFMPVEGFGKLDDTEKHALWAYLQSVPPRPFGQR
jgi:cytochrome c5